MSHSRAHYRFVSPPDDTPERRRQRELEKKVRELVKADVDAKFPPFDGTNMEQYLATLNERQDFESARLTFHCRAFGFKGW